MRYQTKKSNSENLQCRKHGSDPGQNAQLMTTRNTQFRKSKQNTYVKHNVLAEPKP